MKHTVEDLIYKEEVYAIMGGCFAVYRDKGCGFLKPVYQNCLEIEFECLKLPAVAQPFLALTYRGRPLKHHYQPDFICHGKIVLEIKAVSMLLDEHRAQVLNYLAATEYKLGLLVNFGHHPRLEWERIASTRKRVPAPSREEPVDFAL